MWRRHPFSGHEEQRGDQGRADASGLPRRRRAGRGQRTAPARREDRRLRPARVTDPGRHCRYRVRLDGLVHRPGQELRGHDSAQEPIEPFLHAPNMFRQPAELRQNDRRLYVVEPETPPEKWSNAATKSYSKNNKEPGRHPRIVQMSVQHAPTKTGQRSQALDTRVPGRWLVLARGIWITLVVLTLAIFFASLPVYIAQLQTPCAGSTCGFQQLTPEQVGALTGMGLSLSVYVAFTVALALASVVVCLVVSTLIVWRRSDHRMALLVALMLVTFGPIFATRSVSASPSPWQVPNECLTFFALGLLVLVFLLFPSGQFVPHWMRWTSVVLLAGLVSVVFVAPLKPNTLVELLTYLMAIGELATVVLVQLYRYRRVSSPLERQQTKWVVFGIAVPATIDVIVSVSYLLFPVLAERSSLYPLAQNVVFPFLPLFLPLSF